MYPFSQIKKTGIDHFSELRTNIFFMPKEKKRF